MTVTSPSNILRKTLLLKREMGHAWRAPSKVLYISIKFWTKLQNKIRVKILDRELHEEF